MSEANPKPRLSATGVDKSFGPTRVLSSASLELLPGEIHALLGENGAGKSTLVKILAGAHGADAGSLVLDGERFAPRSPEEAQRAGIAIVHQELFVCPDLSIEENVMLGHEPARFGFVRRRRLRAEAARALELVAPELSPGGSVARLSPAELQAVCVARALAVHACRVLILDEPTASLSAPDVDRLFRVVRRLASTGISVLYISHFLGEVQRIAERYSVLRDGATVASGRVSDVTAADLVAQMSGRKVVERTRTEHEPGEVKLSARELSGPRLPVSASFELRAGEVLGIAGLVGSGRTELLRALFGLDRVKRGELRIGSVAGPRSAALSLKHGVGLLSEDRKREGLAEGMSVAQNLTLSKLGGLGPFGLVLSGRERRVAETWVEKLRIRAADVGRPVRELSGGNQQKVALARLLHHDVDVLLLDEPTRGIDVASRSEIYGIIDELARAGKAILVVSSQFDELLSISDRIHVMHRGTLGPALPNQGLDERRLAQDAAGVA
ncbi:MAG: sugar ABC transporter ATP-binding protein [Polyangiaceae bacterium]